MSLKNPVGSSMRLSDETCDRPSNEYVRGAYSQSLVVATPHNMTQPIMYLNPNGTAFDTPSSPEEVPLRFKPMFLRDKPSPSSRYTST